jgi:type I restriction enzyme S subunit
MQSQLDLPKGWAYFTLYDIASNEKNAIKRGPFGSAIKKEYFEPSGYKVYQQQNAIYNDFFTGKYYIGEKKFQELKDFELKPGDLLISCSGTIGKIALVPDNIQRGIINQALLKITLDSRIVFAKYFSYLFGSVSFQKKVLKNTCGTAIKNITSVKDLKLMPLPIPPINEQYRIISKVEELFSFLDAGTDSLRRVQAQLKRYRQAVLKYAFDGKLTEDWRRAHKDQIESAQKALEGASLQLSKKQNTQTKSEIGSEIPVLPDGWVHARLENFIYIAARIGWRGLKADEYTEVGPLFLSVYNLNKGNIVDLSETYHISEERYSESPEIQLRNDDILLAKDGAGIGKIGIVQGLTVKATVNSSLLVIRSGLAFKPKFLFYFFKGPRMQELVKSRITGSATPHLFQRDIRKFDLLIPPLLEQEQIIAEIESRFSVVDQVENIGRMSVKQAGHLRQTILKDAFDGKLVSQDSNDQPAEELLECIKAECLSNRNSRSNNQLELSRYVK